MHSCSIHLILLRSFQNYPLIINLYIFHPKSKILKNLKKILTNSITASLRLAFFFPLRLGALSASVKAFFLFLVKSCNFFKKLYGLGVFVLVNDSLSKGASLSKILSMKL